MLSSLVLCKSTCTLRLRKGLCFWVLLSQQLPLPVVRGFVPTTTIITSMFRAYSFAFIKDTTTTTTTTTTTYIPRTLLFDETTRSSSSSSSASSSIHHDRGDDDDDDDDNSSNNNIQTMRVSEIKQELARFKVSISDCFDKESLIQRLIETRNNNKKKHNNNDDDGSSSSSSSSGSSSNNSNNNNNPASFPPSNNKTISYHDIRQCSVKELRQELGKNNIRWNTLLEKEELVRAVYTIREKIQTFSVTGLLRPGQIIDLTEEQVIQEWQRTNSNLNTTNLVPLLLDVYATWCGPCQLLQKQLIIVGEKLGDRIRMAKLDSDQYPHLSSQLHIQGLPTILLLKNNGLEIGRIEGAMTSDQLIQWIESKI